jgi:hypothetical protein
MPPTPTDGVELLIIDEAYWIPGIAPLSAPLR